MQILELSKPYPGGILPPGNNYNYRCGAHELIVCIEGLSEAEIDDYRSGEARFALTVLHNIIFLSYRFGEAPWSDAPYSYWRVSPEERTEPPITTANTRALLSVILLDAPTCVVRALRTVSFSPQFTRLLHANIIDQSKNPISESVYCEAITTVYQRYTSDELVKSAVVTCRGGS